MNYDKIEWASATSQQALLVADERAAYHLAIRLQRHRPSG